MKLSEIAARSVPLLVWVEDKICYKVGLSLWNCEAKYPGDFEGWCFPCQAKLLLSEIKKKGIKV